MPSPDRPLRPLEPPAAPRRAGRRGADLATRIDEAVEPLHSVIPVKLVLVALAGWASSLVLSPAACLAWAGVAIASEALLWWATRPDRSRAAFVGAYLANNLAWLTLGALFWSVGTPAAQATGMAVLLTVATVGVLLFYNVPAVFLAAGSAPPAAALAVFALADGRSFGEMAPVWCVVGLSAFFSLGRAIDTPSAQEQQRRLNDSLDAYEALAANITDLIARTRLTGEFEYASPSALTVLGYRPEELVGRPRLDFCHPDTARQPMCEALDRMLADPSRAEVTLMRMRHKDGRWIWLQSSARVLFSNGAPVAIIDVSRDVTEQIAAAEALREAKAEAESATRAKAEFLANVSHEIRTPMNGVLGALHLLERENISPEGRELMRQASDCGRMLSQLLNDVLDFSKIEAGQLDLSPEPMDAGDALTSVVALLAGQARAKGVELRCEIAGERLWIEADPVRLRQAMFNLVGNAVKFTSEGHVAARLTSRPAGKDRVRVRVEIEDTGIGMDPQAQTRLFERFHQAENSTARRFGGAGLGLSITRALVRMMGGEIGFNSAAGEGSTFWFEFDAPSVQPVRPEAVEDGVLQDIRILLVEDNATNRVVARTMLSRLGASVTEAEDGVAGCDAARSGAFDLILMDIQMPHMSGIEATQAIRGLPGPAADAPIIALTANAMVHQRAEYLAAGMNGMVAKPISAPALLTEIARILQPDRKAMAS